MRASDRRRAGSAGPGCAGVQASCRATPKARTPERLATTPALLAFAASDRPHASEAQGHDHVASLLAIVFLHEATGLCVAQAQPGLFAAQRGKRIQQITHVETDREIGDMGVGLDLFHSFFLLRVVRHDAQLARRQFELTPRYFSLDRIAARCSAPRST